MHQGGQTKFYGVSEEIKNILMRRPKVRLAFGFPTSNYYQLVIKHRVMLFWLRLNLAAYCRYSFARLAPKLGSCTSTYTLSMGEF